MQGKSRFMKASAADPMQVIIECNTGRRTKYFARNWLFIL